MKKALIVVDYQKDFVDGALGFEKAVQLEQAICRKIEQAWELGEYAREQQFDVIELCGVVSNICVLSNAVLLKAALPEAKLIVDARCTASNDDEMNEKALDILQGVQVEVQGR